MKKASERSGALNKQQATTDATTVVDIFVRQNGTERLLADAVGAVAAEDGGDESFFRTTQGLLLSLAPLRCLRRCAPALLVVPGRVCMSGALRSQGRRRGRDEGQRQAQWPQERGRGVSVLSGVLSHMSRTAG